MLIRAHLRGIYYCWHWIWIPIHKTVSWTRFVGFCALFVVGFIVGHGVALVCMCVSAYKRSLSHSMQSVHFKRAIVCFDIFSKPKATYSYPHSSQWGYECVVFRVSYWSHCWRRCVCCTSLGASASVLWDMSTRTGCVHRFNLLRLILNCGALPPHFIHTFPTFRNKLK